MKTGPTTRVLESLAMLAESCCCRSGNAAVPNRYAGHYVLGYGRCADGREHSVRSGSTGTANDHAMFAFIVWSSSEEQKMY